MWPMVQKLNSVVVVGGRSLLKDSAKELLLYDRPGGYLIPLINQILVGQSYPPKSHAPLAIILCPDWKIVEDISTQCRNLGKLIFIVQSFHLNFLCHHFLLSGHNIKVKNDPFSPLIVGCVFANEKSHAVKMSNGCHILVTTPRSLTRMLGKNIIIVLYV